MMQSTMQDFPLNVGMIYRHGRALHGESEVVTFEGDDSRHATFAEVAERVAAADALTRRFVDEVVPRQELRAHTEARADAIAARPTAAVRAAKAAVWSALDLPLDVGIRREADLAATVAETRR
jgi:enoyl-CoA hydratase/carnithine racemase